MSKIDPYVREMCWTGDLFISSISPTQPVFELEWDPGPISTARVTEINQLLSCPTGTVLLKMDVFEEDPVFRSLVQDLFSRASAGQYLQAIDESKPFSLVDKSWILLRRRALNHRLLSLPDPDSSTQPGNNADLRAACRLVFIIWTGSFLFTSPVKYLLRPLNSTRSGRRRRSVFFDSARL